jgi:hypothetical protein
MEKELKKLYDRRNEEAYRLMDDLTRWYHQTDDLEQKERFKEHLMDIEQDLGLLDE